MQNTFPWLLTGFLLLQSTFLLAATPSIPELKDSLNRTYELNQQIDIMNELAWLYRDQAVDSALQWAEKANALAQKAKYPKGLADSYARKALLLFKSGVYREATIAAQQCLDIRKEISPPSELGNVYVLLGNILTETQSFEKAELHYQQAIEIWKSAGLDPILQIRALNGLGILYRRSNHEEASLQVYRAALFILENQTEQTDTVLRANINRNIGIWFFENSQLDSAKQYFGRSMHLLDNWSRWDIMGEIQTCIDWGNVLIEQDSARLALDEYLLYAHDIAEKNGLRSLLPNINQSISLAYEKLPLLDSAIYFQKRFKLLEDSIFNETVTAQISAINVEHDVAEKEQEIENLSLRLFIAFFALVLLGVIVVLSLWLSRQRERRLQSNLQGQLKNQELNFAANMIKQIEAERKTIAYDLHDNLANTLMVAQLNLENMQETVVKLEDNLKLSYNITQEQLKSAHQKVRDLSRRMEKGILKESGLEGGVEALKSALVATGKYEMEIEFLNEGNWHDLETEVVMFQYIRQLLNNIIEHANANEIHLSILIENEQFNLMLEDNGKGFPKNWEPNVDGIGLGHIKADIEARNGKFWVDMEVTEGAQVHFYFPL